MNPSWIADRMRSIETSGIRKIFEMGRALKNPVDLSIGQPDFDVPAPIQAAAQDAMTGGKNGYTVSAGIPPLRDKLLADVRRRFPLHEDRGVVVTSGTSGGLFLALCASVNPGDEVILFDPYFVSYAHLVRFAGGTPIVIDTHPGFALDVDRVSAAVSPRTKVILLNSPANPTGVVYERDAVAALAQLAQKRGILLLSDEIYRHFCYDRPFSSPAEFNPETLVVDGFSKTYAMTGWRLGYVHGPRSLLDEIVKLQQITFVCAPSIAQHAGVQALDVDVAPFVEIYRGKRDRVLDRLRGLYEIVQPGGAFYVYPRVPWGTGTEFVEAAVRKNLLIVPGKAFSARDTHFRLSYAAPDSTLDMGIEILRNLAQEGKQGKK